jgi:regulator of PEP synthase PpsR (kinase-PPPase family)
VHSRARKSFHIHLVSDATGETLNTVARAAAAHYADFQPLEHIYALVRTHRQLQRVLQEIEAHPGIVLFTMVDKLLRIELESRCKELQIPCVSILDPVISSLATYLNAESRPHVGGQHALNAEYFRRIEALNFTMIHDDGQHTDNLDSADVILIGVSRTTKTPTSIYLANRGIKTANVPVIPAIPLPPALEAAQRPLIVGLVASAERIAQIRRNRLISLNSSADSAYVNQRAITDEILFTRRLCQRHNWPVIDVTRRSIEETAAAVLNLLAERRPPGVSQ